MARRKARRSPGTLPQYEDTWQMVVHHLRVWITPPDQEPYRPYLLLMVNLDSEHILHSSLTPEVPTQAQILETVQHAMLAPRHETGQSRHRPRQIEVESADILATLQQQLATIEVATTLVARSPLITEIIEDLEEHLRGGPNIPGLLSVERVSPALVADLFAAAAEFYRAEPWVQLFDETPLAVRLEAEADPRFFHVMGGAGMEYGLAMYRRWEDVERIFSFVDTPLEALAPEGGHSLLFEDTTGVPFDDLLAWEQHHWQIASPAAYPVPLIFTPQGQVKRPDRADLLWYETVLRAIPIFVADHLPPTIVLDPDAPLEVKFTVPTHDGQRTVHMTYPAGTLPIENRPVERGDWPDFEADQAEGLPAFDRRAMEGFMRMFAPDIDDPALEKAQDLMYQAWEEQNPARRLILAHEALAVSANCADAYVLLAEEEADTIARALAYYQQGVAAGERALGEAYFTENAGHFWGLLETRPYMRARQGLANTLWELNRFDECLVHYREMLHLNPGDNQGVRYSLLNILIGLNRDDEARALLNEYEDDAAAEWLYSRALLTFRQSGAGPAANRALDEALKMNPYVPHYLTGKKRIPGQLPPYIAWGEDSEAASYAASNLALWRQTPGAVGWLKEKSKSQEKPGEKRKK